MPDRPDMTTRPDVEFVQFGSANRRVTGKQVRYCKLLKDMPADFCEFPNPAVGD